MTDGVSMLNMFTNFGLTTVGIDLEVVVLAADVLSV